MGKAGQRTRTEVGIVGAGPAGLLLSHLLHLHGIDSVVLEQRSRDYVERRIRAGVLEQNTVDLLNEAGLGERLGREGLVHHGIELRFAGERHRIPLTELTQGRSITVYGQQEVVKDLIAARLAAAGEIRFEADVLGLENPAGDRPAIRYRAAGVEHRLECAIIAGCDGFHGVCRQALPAGLGEVFERVYPYSWVGVLAAVEPSTEELIYANHAHGFALHSLRSPQLSRLYLQCDAEDSIDQWSDARIWAELQTRFGSFPDWRLKEGPILEKGITAMRGFVREPMQYGRLFLAGDAAHIVPPTGAKGLNLAAADINRLTEALVAWLRGGRGELLESYTARCLARVWRAQDFSYFMTTLLHRAPGGDAYEHRLQQARLAYIARSPAAARGLAENYVGLPDW